MNNAVFRKAMENIRNYRDIKLVTTKRRKKYLVSEPNYHTVKFFTENLSAMEMKKVQIIMHKAVYLESSMLNLSKTITYEFWYDFVKRKYGENAKSCYMDTDSFIVHVKKTVFTKTLQKMLKQDFTLQK